MSTSQIESGTTSIIPPHAETLKHASLLAIKQDKPIMLDYFAHAQLKKCSLKKTSDGDTILYKSQDEYTSPLKKVFKIDKSKTANGCDVICISENSIYLVHSNLLS